MADGTLLNFGEVPRDLSGLNANNPGLDLFRDMLALGEREAAEIAERFPKVQRRVGGYNLDWCQATSQSIWRICSWDPKAPSPSPLKSNSIGVTHHVALSVVGTERLNDSGYFRAKLAQEKLIESSPIPYTLIHATQFFEFVRGMAQSATEGEVVRLSHSPFQPMAAEDVATAVAETALAKPANSTIEIAGPDSFYIDELVRKTLRRPKYHNRAESSKTGRTP